MRSVEQSSLGFKPSADLEISLKGIVREPSVSASGDVSPHSLFKKVVDLSVKYDSKSSVSRATNAASSSKPKSFDSDSSFYKNTKLGRTASLAQKRR